MVQWSHKRALKSIQVLMVKDLKKNKVFLGLGSNLGDRELNLVKAKHLIGVHDDIRVDKVSTIYEAEPWPKHVVSAARVATKKKQAWHLNQVIQIQTSIKPDVLLEHLQNVEKVMGKVSNPEWGPRLIDIDILLYDERVFDSKDLTIPHPHITDRQFVLVPLLEIAPTLKDPLTGKDYAAFLEQIKEKHVVQKYKK